MKAREMIATHPDVQDNVSENLIRLIEAGFDCAQTCTSCADACLAEEKVQNLRQCIRLNLDCADICAAAARMASRRTGSNENVLRHAIEACAAACRACGEECSQHAEMHEHCRICADACKRCADACEAALADVG